MEWTRDKTLSLINEYKQRRGLWDMTCEDYRKKEMKQKLLVEVSSCLGGNIPIPEIEKKFHTLRTQYHREINRMKRKEPYNSKWFGYKTLQFLSSPRACRNNKGRAKSEITEDGTVTKYVITEAVSSANLENSRGSTSSNMNEEFLTIHRKPATITYEAVNSAVGTNDNTNAIAVSNGAHELEKLIEETTKDVEDIDEAKPKVTIKDISVPLDQHSYSGEITVTEQDQHHHHHQQQSMDESDEQPIETIDLHANENGELQYQTSSGNVTNNTTVHQLLPARIIKLQRRDATSHEGDYYSEHHQQQHQTHHHQQPTKRIYYDANTHSTTILTTPTISTSNGNSTLLTSPPLKIDRSNGSIGNKSTTATEPMRDEFSTYGEYVANEIRSITNREILIALKHKINTALFEANMAELQK